MLKKSFSSSKLTLGLEPKWFMAVFHRSYKTLNNQH